MQATLTFTSPDVVVADDERPGLLRSTSGKPEDGDVRNFTLRDLSDPDIDEPGLEGAGFETVDMAENSALQAALSQVRDADELTDETIAAIRASLDGAVVRLRSGASLRFDHLVDDGMFHRRSGPNGLNVNPGGMDGPNGHGGAEMVHGDQDVYGTPLRQLMDGAAPDSFRHVTPDGRNDDAGALLINFWIPLYAPVQPLALMDRQTLDAQRHQLRYGLQVDGFLERDEDATVNDIWKFLYDESQDWYTQSDMGPSHAYVFDTLGLAHGAAALAGEEALEELYVLLHRACEGHKQGDPEALRALSTETSVLEPPADATPTIHGAWQAMFELLGTAATSDPDTWCSQAEAAMSATIRRSIELRLVASLITD